MSFADRIHRLVRPEIQQLSAYQVADSSGMIKLDAMENPFLWPTTIRDQWLKELADTSLNRYPHPTAPALTDQIRRVMQVPEEQAILLGNGSDEIIQLLTMAVARPGAVVMAPTPGFVMYQMIATYMDVEFSGVPLLDNFDLDVERMEQDIIQKKPAILYLAQPNNPTGNLWLEQDVQRLIKAMEHHSDGLVVIDEAYLPFSDRDHMSWLEGHPHVVVMRTLSKVGLAGLRLGMLFGHPELIEQINKVRMPYNINVLTQKSAEFALRNYQFLQEQCAEIRHQRQRLVDALPTEQYECFPSQANFVLVRCRHQSARDIFEALKRRGILIKCLDGGDPLLEQCLRLTVGNDEETGALIAALNELAG